MPESEHVPARIDATKPSPARMYDYMLGGSSNFQVDREATERFREQMPALYDAAWANRGFHGRAIRWMATQRGIRQFLDIGSGLPTQSNTHEVAHSVDPAARVVYVDIDPMVPALAGKLLTGDGTTAVIQADLRDPEALLSRPELRAMIDFGQPAGLLMTAVIQFVDDSSDPWGLVARYVRELCPGSYLALSHITRDKLPPAAVEAGVRVYQSASESAHPRTLAEITGFFDGLELVPPYAGAGPVVSNVGMWGAENPGAADSDGSRAFYCGVARRP